MKNSLRVALLKCALFAVLILLAAWIWFPPHVSNDRPDADVSKIANEVSTSASVITELLCAKGKSIPEIEMQADAFSQTNTDLYSDRNSDGKPDVHYAVWFDATSSQIRAIDVDINNDGNRDWRIDIDYSGEMPRCLRIDTNLDFQTDVYLPIDLDPYGQIDKINLDGCEKQFGVSGEVSLGRTVYGSLDHLDVELKVPSHMSKKVDITTDSSSRPISFKLKL